MPALTVYVHFIPALATQVIQRARMFLINFKVVYDMLKAELAKKMHFSIIYVPFPIRLARPFSTKIPTVTAKKASKTPSTKTATFQQLKQAELCSTSSVS